MECQIFTLSGDNICTINFSDEDLKNIYKIYVILIEKLYDYQNTIYEIISDTTIIFSKIYNNNPNNSIKLSPILNIIIYDITEYELSICSVINSRLCNKVLLFNNLPDYRQEYLINILSYVKYLLNYYTNLNLFNKNILNKLIQIYNSNFDIMLSICKWKEEYIKKCDKSLLNSIEFLIEYLKLYPFNSKKYINNKNITEIIKSVPGVINYIDLNTINNKKEITLIALNNNIILNRSNCNYFSKDKEIILLICKNDINLTEFDYKIIDDILLKDQKFIIELIKINYNILFDFKTAIYNVSEYNVSDINKYQIIKDYNKDKTMMLEVIKYNNCLIKNIDESLLNDFDIILEALNKYKSTIIYLSNTILQQLYNSYPHIINELDKETNYNIKLKLKEIKR